MKKFLKFIAVGSLVATSAITLSACSMSDIFDKALDAAVLEEAVELLESEKEALKEKLDAIEGILDENGFIVVHNQTDNGIIWDIVEKPEESIEEADEEEPEVEENTTDGDEEMANDNINEADEGELEENTSDENDEESTESDDIVEDISEEQ